MQEPRRQHIPFARAIGLFVASITTRIEWDKTMVCETIGDGVSLDQPSQPTTWTFDQDQSAIPSRCCKIASVALRAACPRECADARLGEMIPLDAVHFASVKQLAGPTPPVRGTPRRCPQQAEEAP